MELTVLQCLPRGISRSCHRKFAFKAPAYLAKWVPLRNPSLIEPLNLNRCFKRWFKALKNNKSLTKAVERETSWTNSQPSTLASWSVMICQSWPLYKHLLWNVLKTSTTLSSTKMISPFARLNLIVSESVSTTIGTRTGLQPNIDCYQSNT